MTGKSLLSCTLASVGPTANMLTYHLIIDSYCHSDLLLGKVQEVRWDITLASQRGDEMQRTVLWNLGDRARRYTNSVQKSLKNNASLCWHFLQEEAKKEFHLTIHNETSKNPLFKLLSPNSSSFCLPLSSPCSLVPLLPLLFFLLLPQVKKGCSWLRSLHFVRDLAAD